MISSLIIGVVLALASPFIAYYANGKLAQAKRERAYKRLDNDPFIFEGSPIKSLHVPGVAEPIMVDCFIEKWDVGMLVIRDKSGRAMVLTGEEFERVMPIYEPLENK